MHAFMVPAVMEVCPELFRPEQRRGIGIGIGIGVDADADAMHNNSADGARAEMNDGQKEVRVYHTYLCTSYVCTI